MATATATHRCLAGPACRAAEIIDDEHQGAPTEEANTLCPVCLKNITNAIRQLTGDWARLYVSLGDRSPGNQLKASGTPTPPIPISARKEALMAEIVETAERAATLVAQALHKDPPTGRRRTAPAMNIKDRHGGLEHRGPHQGSAAGAAEDTVHPTAYQRLTAAIRLIEPNIDLLSTAPAAPFAIWDKAGEDLYQPLQRDEQTGEPTSARGRLFVDLTGLDLAQQLTKLHHDTRAELGQTRLRERLGMPCPNCGGRIIRNDGNAEVSCDNDRCTPKGPSAWTDREYKLLAELAVDEKRTMDDLKYWLAEAYWRLDTLAEAADIIGNSPDLDTDPKAGRTVLDLIYDVLKAGAGHHPAAVRAIATDRNAARTRQVDQDNWVLRNEKPYERPKRKPRKATRPAGPTPDIMVDTSEAANACRECNLIHKGECA